MAGRGQRTILEDLTMAIKSKILLAMVDAVALLYPTLSVAVEGDYSSTYAGSKKVTITKNGDVYKVHWTFDNGGQFIGVGLLSKDNNTFTVASVTAGQMDEYMNGTLHISVYKIERQNDQITKLVSDCAGIA